MPSQLIAGDQIRVEGLTHRIHKLRFLLANASAHNRDFAAEDGDDRSPIWLLQLWLLSDARPI